MASSVSVPSLVGPWKKATLPVGVPRPRAVTPTLAVKVTDRPRIEGLTAEVTLVVVAALMMVKVSAT
jgi:hypothetical protein